MHSADFDIADLDDMALNIVVTFFEREDDSMSIHDYCKDWRLTGALIEKYKINVTYFESTDGKAAEMERVLMSYGNYKKEPWTADFGAGKDNISQPGTTPSVAVARAIVMLSSRRGSINIPEHLAHKIPGYMQIVAMIVMIIVGDFAYRSATYIYSQVQGGFAARLAVTFSRSPAREFLTFYVIARLPLAFINGFLLRFSWIDCAVVGIGTWICMLASIALARRFNPVIQFYLFASVSLIWLVVDACASIFRTG
jgi:hypothetical protein